MTRRVLLIDGSNLAARCHHVFHAHSPLAEDASEAEHQHVAEASGQHLRSMIGGMNARMQPDITLLALDHGQTFRHTLATQLSGDSGAYKAGRPAKALSHRLLRDALPEHAEMIGAQAHLSAGYEADDVMASLAVRAAAQGWDVTIVSDDQDMWQIARPGIGYVWCRKHLNHIQIEKKLGFPPDRLALYKALAGDVSDNIPGVRGIGPKTAAPLARAFSSAAELYAQRAGVAARTRTLLEASGERHLLICEQLATTVQIARDQIVRVRTNLASRP